MKIIANGSIAVSILILISTSNVFGKGAASGGQPSAAAAAQPAASPTASSAPASSSTASFESQMLAFGAIDKIAQSIAQNVCAKVHAPIVIPGVTTDSYPVVIYDQATFGNILQFTAFAQNAKAIISSYRTFFETLTKRRNITPEAAQAAEKDMELADTVTDQNSTSLSFSPDSDFTSLLSALAVSSNTETYGSVTIPDGTVAVAIARELSKLPNCHISSLAYPPLFGQGSAADQAASARIQQIIDSVQRARQMAHLAVPQPTLTTTTAVAGGATTQYPWAALYDIDNLYDNLMNSLIQANASTGLLGSTAVVQGLELAELIEGTPGNSAQPAVQGTPPVFDKNGVMTSIGVQGHPVIKARAAKKPAFVLLATVVAAGGTARDHKTFWTNLWDGDVITYSGGAIVSAALWNAGPYPQYSDILRFRIPLTEQEDFANFNSLTGPTLDLSTFPSASDFPITVSKDSSDNVIDPAPYITGPVANSIQIKTPPSHGTAKIVGNEISYTPTANYTGPDSFSYSIANGAGSSAGTVTVSVNS